MPIVRVHWIAVVLLCACAVLMADGLSLAQAPRTNAETRSRFRRLAPGVMKSVDAQRQVNESYSRHDLVEVLANDAEFGERDWSKDKSPAKDAVLRRDIWSLDFAFKPVRFVTVDVPTRDGRMQRKLIWYMVYSVKNTSDTPVAFAPRIVLVSKEANKVYPDRLIPVAIPLIRNREDRNRTLLNTIEITRDIPPNAAGQDNSLWGVATWEDVDPRTDYFSIYVQGLTNAYQWEDTPGAFKAGDAHGKGRELYTKTLILNFWRPGDAEDEHEREIRFVDYSWEYGQLTPQGFVAKKPNSNTPAEATPSEPTP